MIPFRFAAVDLWSAYGPEIAALAAIALIGYIFGRKVRPARPTIENEQARRETRRAKAVARELEQIAETIRKHLAKHNQSVAQFKTRVCSLDGEGNWRELCRQAEEMLSPTLELATSLSHAYDKIRQQSNQLLTFTEVRTDPLTGVSNRRALDEALHNLFAMLHRYGQTFTLAIFDIDNFKQINDDRGHLHGDQMLQQVAKLIDESVRETDVVARYGGEEFVVIMPNTNLAGAAIFSERLRERVDQSLPVTVSGGVAEALDGDTDHSLLARADSALYSAKSSGRNCVFLHDGEQVATTAVPPVSSGA